jgi:glycosyltransferase involved in cell wall biosynthesis
VTPRVSVVMPVGGDAPWLEAAVGSVLAQTLADLELLVLVKPGHPALHGRLRAFDDDRLRVIGGLGADLVERLNEGLALARAPLVARLDADDLAEPHRLERQAAWLARHADTALVGSYVSSNVASESVAWTNSFAAADEVARYRYVDGPVVHPTWCARRELYERHGGYRVGPFPEDYELMLRWLAAGERLEKIPEPLVFWRRHDASVTRTSARCSDDAHARLKAAFLARDPRLAGRPLGLVNAGRHGRDLARALLEHALDLCCFFDLDPAKIGRRVRDRYPVLPHAALADHPGLFVLVAKGGMGDRATIRQMLVRLGREEGRDFLFVR